MKLRYIFLILIYQSCKIQVNFNKRYNFTNCNKLFLKEKEDLTPKDLIKKFYNLNNPIPYLYNETIDINYEIITESAKIAYLGTLYQQNFQLDEAVTCYISSLKLLKDYNFIYKFFISTILNELGTIYYIKKSFFSSLICYENSLQILVKELKLDHPNIIQLLYNIGKIYFCVNNFQNAINFFQFVYIIMEGKLDKNDPFLFKVKTNLGTSYFKNKMYDEAIKIFTSQLELCENDEANLEKIVNLILNSFAEKERLYTKSLNFYLSGDV